MPPAAVSSLRGSPEPCHHPPCSFSFPLSSHPRLLAPLLFPVPRSGALGSPLILFLNFLYFPSSHSYRDPILLLSPFVTRFFAQLISPSPFPLSTKDFQPNFLQNRGFPNLKLHFKISQSSFAFFGPSFPPPGLGSSLAPVQHRGSAALPLGHPDPSL